MTRGTVAALACAVTLSLAPVAALKFWLQTRPAPTLALETGRRILDRQGQLLRAFPVADGRWRLAATSQEIDPLYLSMLFAYEDRRFAGHRGVDLRALVRAFGQAAGTGRVVSGGSTLTMQVARLLGERSTRTLTGKLHQIGSALVLERHHSKEAILDAYLTLAPFGGNIEGVHAASLAYFGKLPTRLSAAEAALLVALPQAPEARRPDRDPASARAARDRVLARAQEAGIIDERQATLARRQEVPSARRPFPVLAAHESERAARAIGPGRSVRLTIQASLQGRLEQLARERARAVGDQVSAAILVADYSSGEILASVGSAGLFADARQGHVDMTRAVRSPGSTLKPMIYGLAFELGLAHPETLIDDRPTAFAGYAPTNFDREFRGTLPVRRALALSLNVPAVKLLHAVGPNRLVARMRRAGAAPVLSSFSPPGLAIGLGGVGVTLYDLVALHAALARGGTSVELVTDPARSSPGARPRQVLGARAAWYVADALTLASRPALAMKTGTSYGYRDAWALGFDGRHVVGVWVGRPDGAPIPGLVAADVAVPVLLDAFARVGPMAPRQPPPPGILNVRTTELPRPLRRFEVALRDGRRAAPAPEIAYPPDQTSIELGLSDPDAQPLFLKVRDGIPPFVWFADGAPIARKVRTRSIAWRPPGPGFVDVMVMDATGATARANVFVD